MKRIQRAAGAALCLLALSAIPAQAQDLPEGVTEELIEEGRGVYTGAGLCAACHGADAKGLVGPDLTDREWLTGEGTFEEIIRQITDGVTADQAKNPMGAIMPPRGGSGISDDQVRAVAAYVWKLSNGGVDVPQRD